MCRWKSCVPVRRAGTSYASASARDSILSAQRARAHRTDDVATMLLSWTFSSAYYSLSFYLNPGLLEIVSERTPVVSEPHNRRKTGKIQHCHRLFIDFIVSGWLRYCQWKSNLERLHDCPGPCVSLVSLLIVIPIYVIIITNCLL